MLVLSWLLTIKFAMMKGECESERFFFYKIEKKARKVCLWHFLFRSNETTGIIGRSFTIYLEVRLDNNYLHAIG